MSSDPRRENERIGVEVRVEEGEWKLINRGIVERGGDMAKARPGGTQSDVNHTGQCLLHPGTSQERPPGPRPRKDPPAFSWVEGRGAIRSHLSKKAMALSLFYYFRVPSTAPPHE